MGRMIYSRIVIDMASGDVLEAQGKMYEGPLALCGGGSGGGSSTTNTVDYGYNARMASLSEEQQNWAREYFGVWQDYQKPYEIAQTQANMQMLPKEIGLYGNQLDSANSLLPLETLYIRNQLNAANQLIPQETSLYSAQLDLASGLLPLEAQYARNQLNAANQLLPQQTQLYASQLGAANELLPLETQYARGQLEAANQMLPKQTELYGQTLDSMSQLLPKQTEAGSKFLSAATKGVDVNERMALASADVGNAFRDARATTARANARMGVNPNSGRFQGIMAALDTQQAAQMAGARTQARVGAEQENFSRLGAAASYNTPGSTLQTNQLLKPSTQNVSNGILQGSQLVKPQTGNAGNSML